MYSNIHSLWRKNKKRKKKEKEKENPTKKWNMLYKQSFPDTSTTISNTIKEMKRHLNENINERKTSKTCILNYLSSEKKKR